MIRSIWASWWKWSNQLSNWLRKSTTIGKALQSISKFKKFGNSFSFVTLFTSKMKKSNHNCCKSLDNQWMKKNCLLSNVYTLIKLLKKADCSYQRWFLNKKYVASISITVRKNQSSRVSVDISKNCLDIKTVRSSKLRLKC